ncbi:hypothetical protein FA048_19150 [Pedobacter polaris]|uniref:Uncharacterized protein n=1 Tax=Pedobacter polaris TaxID=2571273 RepID=A0A4U1CEF9_9SPHI|nr:hypothetical protein [Pedobacter polaris]TKC04581.1 hypothetical protein FA048_19150 [Pedobacter polaris]
MKKHYLYILPALLISLFIYLFYRTEKTVVNDLLINLISKENYIFLKQFITQKIPLNEYIIFSLPEGLWVFCITLTSNDIYFIFKDKEIDLAFLPLLFSVGLELLQLFHITNGWFDLLDVLISLFFWFVAYFVIDYKFSKQDFFKSFNNRSIAFLVSYAIVYLAHVWQ